MKKIVNSKDNGRLYFSNTSFEFERAKSYDDYDYIRINNVPYIIEYEELLYDSVHKYHIRKDNMYISHPNWTIEVNLYFNDFNDEYVEFDGILYVR